MRRPPRPAPIVAAAVLLIVVSSELLLAAVACSVYALADPCDELLPALLGGILLLVSLGFLLLRTAMRALTGRLRGPSRAGEYTTVFGCLAGTVALTVTWLLVILLQERVNVATERVILEVAAVVIVWANTAALLVAGYYFRKCAGHNLTRRAADSQPTEANP